MAVGSENVSPPSTCDQQEYEGDEALARMACLMVNGSFWTVDFWGYLVAHNLCPLTECLYPRNLNMPCRVGRSVSAMNLVRTKLSSIEDVAGQPLTSVNGVLSASELVLLIGCDCLEGDVLI